MRAMRQHAREHDDDLVGTPIQAFSEVVVASETQGEGGSTDHGAGGTEVSER
jgi:hypothetical protein